MHAKIIFCLFGVFLASAYGNDVQKAFKDLEIVPDMLGEGPKAKIEVKYEKNEVKFGNELTPTEVKEIPTINYESEKDSYYTLVFADPDAPSRADPKVRSWLHWLVVNIPGDKIKEGDTITEYVGSGPPKGTDLHRYVFLLYKQPGKIEVDEPHHKNTNGNRGKFNVENFAAKYKLGQPIAGNFYQAQYDDSVPALHRQLGF